MNNPSLHEPNAMMLTSTGAPECFRFMRATRRDPEPGEVLIRNEVAGVNNIDLLFRSGSIPAAHMPALPMVLGVEGAGVVEALGAGVASLELGQRVMWLGKPGAGGYGRFSTIAAAYVVAIADHVDFDQAAATPVAYATAHHMLFDYGRPEPRSWILVRSAAGGVGTATLQLARNAGLRAIGVADGGKLDHVRANGAEAAIDYKREDVVARAHQITEGKGVALALNATAGTTLVEDLRSLAPLGQVISFGHLAGPPEGSAADLLLPFFSKSVGIRVSDIYTYYDADSGGMHHTLVELAADLAAGRIDPHILRTFPIEQAADAHRLLESGRAVGKVMLRHATTRSTCSGASGEHQGAES